MDILTEEEYMQIKDPTYRIRKYLEKEKNIKMQELQSEINRLKNIIDLSYDKKGKPVFRSMEDIVSHNIDDFIEIAKRNRRK